MASPAATDLVGLVLAGRYRLLAPVGTGAGGRVYIADDVRLRRRVAVKVLHSALADDAGFLRRFRTEAQLAASVHHPHIVTVYDWGDDDGVPFMVLELLRGGSLRAMLDAGRRLTPSQAAHIGRQVVAALRSAHARGLVHRDIKPANLLFDEHGLVRVADFGLARALAEASWTEPAGAVVGTARYAAPEQASGSPLDGRADLYSLAVVLTEACTGQVPMVAETALGTLATRGIRSLSAPPELGGLGVTVERAGRADPAERYTDAAAMGRALARVTQHLPAPEPLVLPGLGDGLDDLDPTRVGGPSGAAGVFDQDGSARPPASGLSPPDDATTSSVAEGSLVIAPPGRRRSSIPVFVGTAIIAAIVVGLVALAGAVGGGGPSVAVPNLTGREQTAAAAAATEARVLMKVVARRTADDPAGFIIEQRPAPGAFLERGGEIEVVVSRGPPPVAVPTIAGQPVDAARAALEQVGFVVIVERAFDESVPKDAAIGTDPAGAANAPRESTVKLIVSDGPAPVPVPEVAGKSYDDAVSTLKAAGFKTSRRDVFDATIAAGTVVGTDPPAKQAASRNSTVTVIVSKGPEIVTVPNLKNKTVEQASQSLTALGLVPDVQNYSPGKTVRAQDPDSGTQVPKGTKVTLFL